MSQESDQKERMRNLLMYKQYLTDKEMEAAAPAIIVFGVIVLVIIALAKLFAR